LTIDDLVSGLESQLSAVS